MGNYLEVKYLVFLRVCIFQMWKKISLNRSIKMGMDMFQRGNLLTWWNHSTPQEESNENYDEQFLFKLNPRNPR